jgi:hypothetical protein
MFLVSNRRFDLSCVVRIEYGIIFTPHLHVVEITVANWAVRIKVK